MKTVFFTASFSFFLYLFFTIVSPDSSPTRVVNPSETSVDSAKWYCGTKTSHCFRFSAVMTTFCDVYQVEQNTRGLDTELAKQRCWSHDGEVKVTPVFVFFAIAFNFLLPIFLQFLCLIVWSLPMSPNIILHTYYLLAITDSMAVKAKSRWIFGATVQRRMSLIPQCQDIKG